MQYYILMVDYGRNYPGKDGPSGYQAVVDPEQTRASVIREARDILAGNRLEIAHVKFVDGNFIEDVTAEIIEAAQQKEAA